MVVPPFLVRATLAFPRLRSEPLCHSERSEESHRTHLTRHMRFFTPLRYVQNDMRLMRATFAILILS